MSSSPLALFAVFVVVAIVVFCALPALKSGDKPADTSVPASVYSHPSPPSTTHKAD